MMKNEINWYEAIGLKQGALVGQLVQSSLYAAVVSVEELAAVTMECKIPMVKLCWRIHDRSRQIEKSGETAFPEGVYTLVLGEVLPLQELKAYETADAAYGIETFVTLAAGDEIGGPYAFRASLHSGKPTDSMPEESLPARLAAIPIASPDMTEEQLRQICLDYMGLQVEFPYRLDRDFSFVIESQRRKRTLMGGQVYGGIPYISRGAGNLYRIAEICDPKTGVLNTSDELFDNIRYFGNACSGAASTAWSRVVTSAYLGYTMFMCPGNGFLPVGPYTGAEDSVTMYDRKSPDGVCCRKICDRNGPETMYESYAMMKPADGLVCDGHVRMNGVVPVVVRRADGTIDPDESFTLLREQVCYVSDPSHIRIAPDGSHYTSQGRKTYRNSFRMLFDAGYLPFTFAEFSDPSKVQGSNLESAVMAIMNLKELGVPYIVAKAKNKSHMKIFKKLGVNLVVRPEKEMGERIAKMMLSKNIIDLIEIDEDYSIVEISAPQSWVGKTLVELNVRGRYGMNVIAIRYAKNEQLTFSPDPNYVFENDDQVMVITQTSELKQFNALEKLK